MRRNPALILSLSSALLIAGGASALTLRDFRQSPVNSIPLPTVPDSVNKENSFDVKSLLDSRSKRLDRSTLSKWAVVETDTAGRIRLAKAEKGATLTTFATRIRADRFAKGRLVLSSTGRATVRIDGKSVISKSVGDSLPTDNEASIELLPSRAYDITVDVLSSESDPVAPDFSLEFLPAEKFKDVAIESATDLKQKVQPVTALTGERAYRALLSDDGSYLFVVTGEQNSPTDRRTRTRVYETAGGKLLAQDLNGNCRWMPGENKLYYTVARGNKYDLFTIDIPVMTTTLLASDLPTKDFNFSPGGKWIIYTKTVDSEKESGPMHRVKTPDDRIPGDRDREYLMRYDLETGLSTPLTHGGLSTGLLDFTRNGDKLLYMSTTQTPDRYPFYYADIIELDTKTLQTDTIIRGEEGYINAAIYSPDAKKLFVIGGPDSFGGIGANYAPHEIGNGFDGQGYIFDIATRSARAMTRDFDPALKGQPVWNARDGKIYFLGESGFYQNLYSLDPATGKIAQLEAAVPYIYRFNIGSNEDKTAAYVGGSFTTDGVVGITDLKNGKSRVIDNPLAPTLEETTFGEMRPWTFTTSDGTEIDGYECLPPDFDPSKKYPLIVYYYGGTSPSNATFYHLYSPQVFASRGYVVYVVNPSGTTGYGQEYSARHVNAWGRRTANDIIEGVKKFRDTHSYVDGNKIGCIGASYGGFMTQYLQTQTDIFAAAVSHAGISNVTSYWGEGFWGYSYNAVAAAKSYPWTDPKLYTEQGSLFNADKIHTPILLLHGEVDTNVPIGESIQLFNALRILGRDVELITVEDENHVISDYERRQIWQNTIMAWFAKWLQDDSRWWDELYK